MIYLLVAATLALAHPLALGEGAQSATATRVLPNGLKVVVRARTGLPIVALDLWVLAGTGMETAGEEGAAHFVEHLLFRGTATRASGESDAAVEALGGVLNAGTTRDGAHVYTTVPSSGLDEALEVIADMAMRPLLRDADVDLERGVILDEVAAAASNPDRAAIEGLMASLYPGHGYGRPLLGSPEALRRLDAATVRSFHARCWSPRGAVLVLVGNVDAGRAIASAERVFGGWGPTPASQEPPLPASLSLNPAEDLPASDQVVLGWAYRADALGGRDRLTLDALAAVAGAAPGGRLRRELASMALPGYPVVEARQLRGGGVLSVLVGCDRQRVGDVRAAVERVMGALAKQECSGEEIRHAAQWLASCALFDKETVEGEARSLATAELLRLSGASSPVADPDGGVSAADVHALSRRLLDAAHSAHVVVPLARSGRQR